MNDYLRQYEIAKANYDKAFAAEQEILRYWLELKRYADVRLDILCEKACQLAGDLHPLR